MEDPKKSDLFRQYVEGREATRRTRESLDERERHREQADQRLENFLREIISRLNDLEARVSRLEGNGPG